MRNLRAAAASLKPLFENPELGAMAEICEILQGLPDDAARLRVMRWSFARFGGEEFKRSVPGLPAQAAVSAPAATAPGEPSIAEELPEFKRIDTTGDAEDLASQVSELKDLFPRRVALNKPRPV